LKVTLEAEFHKNACCHILKSAQLGTKTIAFYPQNYSPSTAAAVGLQQHHARQPTGSGNSWLAMTVFHSYWTCKHAKPYLHWRITIAQASATPSSELLLTLVGHY
jgi:hypothetical protein